MSDRIYKATVKTGLSIHINSNNGLNRYKKRCVLFSPDKMQTQFSRNKIRDSHTHFVKQVLCLPWVPNKQELQAVTVPSGLKIGQKPRKTTKILIEKTKPRTIPWLILKEKKKFGPFLDLCVSSLRRGHANLLCIVPILSDVPKDELLCSALLYKFVPSLATERCGTSWFRTKRLLLTWAGISLKLGLSQVFEIWASIASFKLPFRIYPLRYKFSGSLFYFIFWYL
jgi:hypothetical protein